MTAELREAQRRLSDMLRRSHFLETVTYTLCIISAGIAAGLIVHGVRTHAAAQPPPWGGPFAVASPIAWATAFLISAGASAGAVAAARKIAAWPLGIMTALWCAWAVLLVVGSRDGGVPTAAIGSIGYTWLWLLACGAYALEAQEFKEVTDAAL